MITIKIPWKTPSVNHLYFNFRGRRGLTNEATKLRKQITELVDNTYGATMHHDDLNFDVPLKVTTRIHEDWYYKNGNIKRADVANREKFLTDSVFKCLGLKDENIFESIMIKVQNKTDEFAVITIEELTSE